VVSVDYPLLVATRECVAVLHAQKFGHDDRCVTSCV